jgi:hypothetical protein
MHKKPCFQFDYYISRGCTTGMTRVQCQPSNASMYSQASILQATLCCIIMLVI